MRALVAALVALLALPAAANAATDAPWQTAGKVTDGLFDAQTELVLTGPREAAADARAGAAGVHGRVPGDAARGRSGRRSRGRRRACAMPRRPRGPTTRSRWRRPAGPSAPGCSAAPMP